MRQVLNMDNVTWECDYPHSDTTWPRSPEIAGRQLEGLTDQEINKVTHENAMTHFSYNPFAHFERGQCTVGALRAKNPDHDVSIRSSGKRQGSLATKSAELAAMWPR